MVWPWKDRGDDPREYWLRETMVAIAQVRSWVASPEAESIRPADFLGSDLGLSSVAVARLAGILQKRFGRGALPFYALFVSPDGALLQDIRVSDVASFLERHAGRDGS